MPQPSASSCFLTSPFNQDFEETPFFVAFLT